MSTLGSIGQGWKSAVGVLVGTATLFGGCASQKTVDEQETTIRALEDQLARERQEDAEFQEIIEQRERDLAQARQVEQQLRTEADRLIDQNQRLQERLARLEDRNAETVRDFEQILNEMDQTVLDPQTDRALARLAADHPDLVTYDADRGMLRFSSDLTFDSGSAMVRDSAKQTLRTLAEVLNSIAASYEVEIVGHTDDQQVSARTAQRHPTNLHLSAHRAIAVRNELGAMGVPADRMKVAGWGAQRPMVPNNTSGGTRENRRVEIFLARASGPASTLGTPERNRAVEPDRQAPPPRQIDTTK